MLRESVLMCRLLSGPSSHGPASGGLTRAAALHLATQPLALLLATVLWDLGPRTMGSILLYSQCV